MPCTGESGDNGAALPIGPIGAVVVLRQPAGMNTNIAAMDPFAIRRPNNAPDSAGNVFRFVQRVMEKPVRKRKVRIGFNKTQDFVGSPTGGKFRLLAMNPKKSLKFTSIPINAFSFAVGESAVGELNLYSGSATAVGVRVMRSARVDRLGSPVPQGPLLVPSPPVFQIARLPSRPSSKSRSPHESPPSLATRSAP